MTSQKQFEIAQALTEVLADIVAIQADLAGLTSRRDELLSQLTGAGNVPAPQSSTDSDKPLPTGDSAKSREPTPQITPISELPSTPPRVLKPLHTAVGGPLDPLANGQIDGDLTTYMNPPELPGAAAFDNAIKGKRRKRTPVEPQPDITPEQQTEYEKMDELYNAGEEKASDAQKRMIFALLGTEHGIANDEDKKAVIVGIIKQQHNGWVLESTKDLSKTWATGVIDYLKKAKAADLAKFYADIEPF